MEMPDKIKKLRAEHNLTFEEIGNAVGVGKSTVKKWENGDIKNMKRDKIASLASILQTTPAYLMGWDDEYPDNVLPMPKMTKIPLLGTIACGVPILADENIEEYVDLPEQVYADFALRCKGDSMINARIFDGDIVYIKKQPTVNNGEIAAVLIGDEATLKYVNLYPNKIVLEAANPTFDDIVCCEEEMNDVSIMGKAVAFTSLVRAKQNKRYNSDAVGDI